MKIKVKMTDDEFVEFTEWRKDRMFNEHKVQEVATVLCNLARNVVNALEECGDGEAQGRKIESPTAESLYVEALNDLRNYQ